MVERCPDKTEVEGPIPSTLTLDLNFRKFVEREERKRKEREEGILKANERCQALMVALEDTYRKLKAGDDACLGDLKNQVKECLDWETARPNKLAEKKDELKEMALKIQRECGFN